MRLLKIVAALFFAQAASAAEPPSLLLKPAGVFDGVDGSVHAGWQVLVFSARGQCIFGSAHPTRAEAARERRRLIRSLGGLAGRGK